jgi:hypothetical protein
VTLERSERPAAGEPAGARSPFPRFAVAYGANDDAVPVAVGHDQAVIPSLRAFVARAAR